MKKLLLLSLLLHGLNTMAQNKFKRDWYINETSDEFDAVSKYLKIKDSTTLFNVVDNQLALKCKNVYNKDTLCLYVINSDQGRGFMGPKFYPPKSKSLFAKCYLRNNEIHIIYTQKLFSDNIKTLQLYTVMYKH